MEANNNIFLTKEASEPRVRKTHRIYLLETRAAGFQYHDGTEPAVQSLLASRQDLVLMREPYNEYDSRAIALRTIFDDHVGYVPRSKNVIFAAMMDQGLPLFAEIISFDKEQIEEEPWQCLRVRVYMLAPKHVSNTLLTLTCPKCSAPLSLNTIDFIAKCEYCGSQHLLMTR